MIDYFPLSFCPSLPPSLPPYLPLAPSSSLLLLHLEKTLPFTARRSELFKTSRKRGREGGREERREDTLSLE